MVCTCVHLYSSTVLREPHHCLKPHVSILLGGLSAIHALEGAALWWMDESTATTDEEESAVPQCSKNYIVMQEEVVL